MLLERLGWSEGYWTILDDGPVERCIAVIGRVTDPAGGSGTDDGEAIAVRDEWVYVFGSLYGKKEGPLEAERQFLARFREDAVEPVPDADLDDDEDPVAAPLAVVADEFRLHRAINDALRDSHLPLLDPGPAVREAVVHRARREAIGDEQPWSWRIRWDDHPINIEGATFLPSGACVLGLRVPVHADGHPLLVVVEGIERAFEADDSNPRVVAVHVVATIGDPSAPVGVRDLAVRPAGTALHLLAGNLDSSGKGSILLESLPEGVNAVSTQWHVDLVEGELPSRDLGAVPDRVFPDLQRVEGLAFSPDGTARCVVDEDEAVGLRLE